MRSRFGFVPVGWLLVGATLVFNASYAGAVEEIKAPVISLEPVKERDPAAKTPEKREETWGNSEAQKPSNDPNKTGAMITSLTTFAPTFTLMAPMISHDYAKKLSASKRQLQDQQAQFVRDNLVVLKEEIAQGAGQYLESLVNLFGCQGVPFNFLGELRTPTPVDPEMFRAALKLWQSFYAEIFREEKDDPGLVYRRLADLLRQRPLFKESCYALPE